MAKANVVTKIPQISFPLEILNVSELESVWSSEVKVHDIPWKIHVIKPIREEKQWLATYLHCAIRDESPDWSHAAFATFKLVPVSGNKNGIERQTIPYVFDCSGIGVGFPNFIEWKELIDTENNYVKDDTLTLDIKIEVADPNDENPSKMLLQTTEKSCDDSCLSKYRLNVTNIDKLIAVKSPQFKIQNSPWVFMACKGSSHLGITLGNRAPSTEFSCQVQMSLKVISSKNEIKPIEPASKTKLFKKSEILCLENIVSWDELMKPENGFINNNSIVIEVEIKAGLVVQGVISNNQKEPKMLKFECAICFEVFSNQEVSSTLCGHLFCTACVKDSIEAHGKCPSCNVDVTLESLHRIYLPIAN